MLCDINGQTRIRKTDVYEVDSGRYIRALKSSWGRRRAGLELSLAGIMLDGKILHFAKA